MIAITRGVPTAIRIDVIQPGLCCICFLFQPAEDAGCKTGEDQSRRDRNDGVQNTVFHQDLLTQDRTFKKLIALSVVSQIFIPDIHVLQ